MSASSDRPTASMTRGISAIPPSPGQGPQARLMWWDQRVKKLQQRVNDGQRKLTQLRTRDLMKVEDDIKREDVTIGEHKKCSQRAESDIAKLRQHCTLVQEEAEKEQQLRNVAQIKKRKALGELAKLQDELGKIDRERQAHETIIANCHKVTKEHGTKHKDLKNQVNSREIIHADLKQVHDEEKNKRESLKMDMKQKLGATMLTGDQWADKVISAEGQLDSYRGACESVRQEIYSAHRRAEAYANAARKNTEERTRHMTSIQEINEEIRELQLAQTDAKAQIQEEQSMLQIRTTKWIEARDSTKVWLNNGNEPISVTLPGKTALFSSADRVN